MLPRRAGSFAYNPTNGTVLYAGTNTLSVTFTPSDPTNYTSVTDIVVLVVSPVPPAQAGLNLPYTPDANTLHLWHLDDPPLINGVTNILATDAVLAAGITLSNLGDPNPGVPPYTDTSLGNPSFAGLGSSLNSTDRNGFCYGGLFSDVSPFCDTNTGAFTFEALVKFTDNPMALPNNMEIICGDQPSGTLSLRGWQFRINTSGQMEFNLLGGNGSDNDVSASLPSTGLDAAVAGQWYHMAVTCTGNNPTNGAPCEPLTFYWTLLDANRTAADVLATFTLTRALNGTTSRGSGTVRTGARHWRQWPKNHDGRQWCGQR